MAVAPIHGTQRVWVLPFSDRFVGMILRWVRTTRELKRLAPSTPWPLTVDKIRAWRRKGAVAYGLHTRRDGAPVGYAELNPMDSRPGQYWLGHVVIEPALQGRGLGRRFTEELARIVFQTHRATRLVLVVFPDNVSAIRCYHSAGFKTVAVEHHAFGDDSRKHELLRLEMGPDDLRPT